MCTLMTADNMAFILVELTGRILFKVIDYYCCIVEVIRQQPKDDFIKINVSM